MDAIAARLAADYPRTNTDVGARVVPLAWATRWALHRVRRCASALQSPLFATHIDTENRSVPDIVAGIPVMC